MKTQVSSSIEYFYEMTIQAFEQYCQGKCSKQQYEYYILLLKAKCIPMHKQENLQTWLHCLTENDPITFEDYYNSTFGSEKTP